MTEAKNLQSEKIVEFNRKSKFDGQLFAAAARVNFAYCDALFHAGVLTRLEAERIKNGLQTILKRAEFDASYFDKAPIDIHSFIELRLVHLIGEIGEKINVGRSRAEQETTALRLWLREEIEEISKLARDLQTALIEAGERQKEAVLPGYVHSRQAQPMLWAHWCLAYFEMFARDRERLDEVWRRVNVLPLGAGLMAGTSFEIDREEIARALGFEGISANSLDAVADTDFAIEFGGACSLLMIHLSRLAEDLILYNSFDFLNIKSLNANSKLSSALRGKNLAVLETVRSKTGQIFGHQIALLSTMKNLPLGIHKDFQENEEMVFETVNIVKSGLEIIKSVLKNLYLDEQKTRETVEKNYLNADELVDYLRQRNVSFSSARTLVDEMISFADSQKKKLNELKLKEMQQFSTNIGEDVFQALSLEQILAGKNQIGGTAPERVFEALENARAEIEREEGK